MSDVIVIGGGIAGLSAGAQLSALGKVLLLERESALGYHASGRSAALYEPNYGHPVVKALSHAGNDVYEAIAGLLSPRGLLLLAGTHDATGFAAEARDMGLSPIDIDAARAMVPILDPAAVAHAAHSPLARDIDTDRLLQHYARAIRDAGGQIVTGAEVTAIRRKASGWTVTLGSGDTHRAATLINAAGAWADGVAALAGVAPKGIQPMRRSVARIPAPDGQDVSGWPMMLGLGESWYAKPDAGALIVSPADQDPVGPHDAWADDMRLAEGLDRYAHMVTAPVTRLLGSWGGLRSFAPDRVLVIGPDPADPGFWWFAGQGGYGFQTAAGASRLLADLVGDKATQFDAATVAALAPARFA